MIADLLLDWILCSAVLLPGHKIQVGFTKKKNSSPLRKSLNSFFLFFFFSLNVHSFKYLLITLL